MKYVLLIYDNPEAREAFFGERGNELMCEIDALVKELTESAELVSAEALADPSLTPRRSGFETVSRWSRTDRSRRPRSS